MTITLICLDHRLLHYCIESTVPRHGHPTTVVHVGGSHKGKIVPVLHYALLQIDEWESACIDPRFLTSALVGADYHAAFTSVSFAALAKRAAFTSATLR
jgi:hypothetical protein